MLQYSYGKGDLPREKLYKSGGAYRLRGTSTGFLEVRLAVSMVGKTMHTIEGGPGALSPEILKPRSFEIAGYVYFSIYFRIFKVFNGDNHVTRKGALFPSL